MRIIKESRLPDMARKHPKAESSLKHWRNAVRKADWKTPSDLASTFRTADPVTLPNGQKVVVFNILGGSFRLVTAVHYNRGIVYIRKFLTHAEYSKEDWKNDP